MWRLTRVATTGTVIALLALAPTTAAVAARPSAPVVVNATISMSDEQASPDGWMGCLATVAADVTPSDKGRAPLTLTWYVGLRGTPVGGNQDFSVNVLPFAYASVTPGVTHYTSTPQVWFNNTTEAVSVYATLSRGQRVVATSPTQTVSLICPSPYPPS